MAKTPFLEAAERCEQLGRSIKERQFGANGVDAFPVEESGIAPPEEAWARRFASHVMSTVRSEGGRPPLPLFLAAPADRPQLPGLGQDVQPAPPARIRQSGHIGSVLGKAGPRQTLVGRLFRGRGK
jgi:hypothetical protein